MARIKPRIHLDLWVFGVVEHTYARGLTARFICIGPLSWRVWRKHHAEA